jgi:hypothetical protein
MPEKKYRYAVAELVYEGFGFATVNFPAIYNKYNFFRIHNLNWYPMRFTFSGSGAGGPDYSITIPGYGMKTVRRTAVDGEYNSDWSYLWKFLPDDPRFFVDLTFDRLYATMAANNVTNPAGVLYSWLEALRRGQDAKFYIDEHEHYDVAPLYAGIYPDPTDTTQLIGNFFHHKGDLQIFDTTIGRMVTRTFNGYGTIVTDIPEITFTNTGTALRMDAIAGPGGQVSTNLLNQHDASTPTIVTLPQTLDHTNTGWGNLTLHVKQSGSLTVAGVTVTIDSIAVNPGGSSLDDLIFHVDTLADVLSFNAWGDPGFTGTDQESNIQTLANRALMLTPWGPRLLCDQQVVMDGSPVHGNLSGSDLLTNPMNTIGVNGSGAVMITAKQFIQFEGWGWGRISISSTTGFPWDNDRTFKPGFLSARVKRATALLPSYPAGVDGETGLAKHPYITNDLSAVDGEDFDLLKPADNYKELPYAFQAAMDLDGGITAPHRRLDKASFNWWAPPDTISANPTLVPLLIEHYNALAAMVNSVKKIRPVDFLTNFKVLLADGTTVVSFPGANFTGVVGSNICPKAMYCSVTFGSNEHEAMLALGIPVYTAADLPADLVALYGMDAELRYHGANWNDTITAANNTTHNYTASRAYVGEIDGYMNVAGLRDGAGGFAPERDPLPVVGLPGGDPSHDLFNDTVSFFWVKIADVQAKAEELGWNFLFQQAGHSYSFELADPGPSLSLLFGLPATGSYNFSDLSNTHTVGDVLGGDQVFFYHDRSGYMIEDSMGDWKGPVISAYQSVADLKPGDVGPAGFIDAQLSDTVGWSADGTDDQMLAAGETNAAMVDGRRYVTLYNFYSSAYTNNSQALFCPLAWVKVAQNNFSAISKANFNSRLASGTGVITCTSAAKAGSTTQDTIDAGENTFGFRTNGWDAVVAFWDTLIAV